MKRFVTLLLSLCLCGSLLIPCASAVQSGGLDLIYNLTMDSGDAESIEKGSIVTITFSILRADDSDDSYSVSVLQNEIIYDQSFFEFVPDSIEVIKSSGSALFQTRVDGTHIIKASYLSGSGGTYQAEEAFCSFQLKVIGSSGSGWVACDWDRAKAYDGENAAITLDESANVIVTVSADTDPGANPGTDPGTDPGANPGTDPGANPGVEAPCHSFIDVATDDWFHEAVDYVESNGLMNGVGDNLFDPSGNMTRAMLVTTLYRLEGSPAVNSANLFSDVEAGQWYTDAIIWGSENNIIEGYGNGIFGPTDDVTREQMACIMYRYASFKGYSVAETADLSGYTDVGDISGWALSGMSWANATGLITGRTTTTLVPQGNATRAEVATILMRFCENLVQ